MGTSSPAYGSAHRVRVVALVGLLVLVGALIATSHARAANPETLWATNLGSPTAGETSDASDVAALPDGSRIMVGSFSGTLTLGSTTLTSPDATGRMFVAKFDANGNAAWATQAQGTGLSEAQGVAVLPDGSAIITGLFRNTVVFGSTSLTAVGASDVVIAKLDPNGAFVWAIGAGGPAEDEGNSVATFADGSSVISGEFKTSITFGATTLISTNGFLNGFAVRLDANGTPTWATKMSSSGPAENNVYAKGIAPLSGGATMVTGGFSGTTTFGSLPPLTAEGASDAYVARLSAAGAVEWVARAGGSGRDGGEGISTLADGSAIVTGSFENTAAFPGTTALTSTGTTNGFVAKIKPDGTFSWATRIVADRAIAGSVSTRRDGTSVITGTYSGTATLGSTTLPEATGTSTLIARIGADGAFSWAVALVTDGSQSFGRASYLPDGSIVAVGFFQGNATFGSTAFNGEAMLPRAWTIGLLTTPEAPTGVRVTRGTREITVSWTAVPGSRVSGYRVATSPGKRTCEATGAETSCVVKRLTGGKAYRFTVQAINAAAMSIASRQSTQIRPAPNASVRIESMSGRRGRITARVRVNTAGPVVLRARDGSKTVCLARARATGPGTIRLACRANAATRRQLWAGPVRLQVSVTLAPPAALKSVVTRSVLLYRG